jgi:hypothetical protein
MSMEYRLQEALRNLEQQAGYAAGAARAAAQKAQGNEADIVVLRQALDRQQRDFAALSEALASLKTSHIGGNGPGGPAVMRIENLPGRRIPFDLLVEIPIGPNITSQLQQTVTISQDGPFVAQVRYAAFQSTFQYSVSDPQTGAAAQFQGRSYGRWRPIHSMNDHLDGVAGVFNPVVGLANPGNGSGIYASPSNHAGFRSMEFDGVIEMINAGSGWPRSNGPVPTPFWTTHENAPFQLGALDFFERGETLQFKVIPTHSNNPPAGNVFGFGLGGSYPFADSQFDVHEGVLDPLIQNVTQDPVKRLPQGILVIGLHGFRITQQPGPVQF